MEDSTMPVFTIGVVADIIGVSVQTLRLWEQKGLITPTRKGKDRYYSNEDLERLKYIKHLLTEKKLNTYGVKEILDKKDEEDVCGQECADQESCTVEPSKQKTILVIDDDFDYMSSVKVILESENHYVLTALSGRDGLEKARTQHPDLIILDIMIPDLDGMEICRELKGAEEYKHIPILINSSIPMGMREKFGIRKDELNADEYCESRSSPALFIQKIRSLLA